MPPIHRDKTLEEYSTGSSSIEAPTGLYNFGVHKKALSCTNPLEEYFNGGGSSSKSHEGMTSAAKQLKLPKEKVVSSPEGSGIMSATSSYTSAAAAAAAQSGREYSHLNSRTCTYTPTAAAAMAAAAEMAAAASAAAAASSHSPHHQLMPQPGLHYYHTNF